MLDNHDLPDDVDRLKRLLTEHRSMVHWQKLEIERLKIQLARLRRWKFGASSEQLDGTIAQLRGGAKLQADDTPLPVLDPGRGRTKRGFLWTYVRDERPWGSGTARAWRCFAFGDGQITLGRIGPIACAAVAADGSKCSPPSYGARAKP